jgi:hypothetical protein
MHLLVEITSEQISAFEKNNQHLVELACEPILKPTPEGCKETLSQLIDKLGNTDRFDQFSCSYFGKEFCMVPNMLFSSSSPEKLLQFTVHREISKNDVEYNRLSEWGSVIVYELPMWIKTALVPKFPRIIINHEITHVMRHLTLGSLVPLRSHLILHENAFTFVVRKDGNIVHASIQEYENEDDVVYHLATAFTQLEINSKNELFVHGVGQKINERQECIVSLLSKINLFNQTKVELQPNHHLQFQQLCV